MVDARFVLQALEVPALVCVPLSLVLCAVSGIEQSALLSLVVVLAALVIFFAGFEASRPGLRQLMPAAVLGALAAAGRILFAPVPDVKPVSAICIMAGAVFGRRTGFIVGALAALVSNFFFGQGPWTAWQMYAWGMVGYCAGVLSEQGFFDTKPHNCALSPILYIFGLVSGLLYGAVMNTWYVIGFVRPVTGATLCAGYLAGLPFDLVHAFATVAFLALLYEPWKKKLGRIRRKYDMKG